MKRILKHLFILSLIPAASAQELASCMDDASLYGDRNNPRIIADNCKEIVINNAYATATDYSQDNYIQAFGAGNILHTVFYSADSNGNPVLTSSDFVAGKNSLLNSIEAVEIDEAKNKVFVLNSKTDGSKNILAFPVDLGGALAAYTHLENESLDQAVNLKVNNDEIFVVSAQGVRVFNANAKASSTLTQHHSNELRSFSLELNSAKDVAIGDNSLYVLDSDKIVVFDKNGADEVVEIIEGDFTSAISLDLVDGKLQVLDNNNQSWEIEL